MRFGLVISGIVALIFRRSGTLRGRMFGQVAKIRTATETPAVKSKYVRPRIIYNSSKAFAGGIRW